MKLKTCLLISNDPDDHTEFSEAISDISDNTILISTSDDQKALKMLKSKLHVPSYIFLDLALENLNVENFLKEVDSDHKLALVPLIIYGEDSDFEKVRNNKFSDFFNRDSNFKELKDFLKKIIRD